jgi:putative holliday junction resolvase
MASSFDGSPESGESPRNPGEDKGGDVDSGASAGQSAHATHSQASEPPVVLPRKGRLLGVDFGTKRVGYAVSDIDQTMSSPLESWELGDVRQDERRLKMHVADNRIIGVVVGLPVHLSGAEGGKSREARKFGGWIGRVTGLPVAYWDERYTSAIANEYLIAGSVTKKGRVKRRDMLAAQVLLQRYLAAADRSAPPSDLGTDDRGPVR